MIKPGVCPLCTRRVLRGFHDAQNRCLEAAPLSPLGEMDARLHRRRTYLVEFESLTKRTAHHAEREPAPKWGTVHVEHDCRLEVFGMALHVPPLKPPVTDECPF